jgi:hypothetical protein
MNLKEWAESYIDYLNTYKKNLKNKLIKEDYIECEYSDKGKIIYYIYNTLENPFFGENHVIICLNTKKNLDFLVKNWKKFLEYKKLKVIFSNPKLNLQWSIIPYLHNMYGDPESLKTGLKSLFSSIPEV